MCFMRSVLVVGVAATAMHFVQGDCDCVRPLVFLIPFHSLYYPCSCHG